MSARERDRLKVLHEVRKRHITQKQAGVELGISVRWVRTLVKRLLREGDRALRHKLRGRPSNRKTPAAVKQRVLELFRQKQQAKLWHDYGPSGPGVVVQDYYGNQVLVSTEDLLSTGGWRELLADFTTGPQTRLIGQGNARSGQSAGQGHLLAGRCEAHVGS